MKKIIAFILIILTLLVPAACSEKAKFEAFPEYEFTTTELKTKEYDEVVITYPAYMDIVLDTQALGFLNELDFQIEGFVEETYEYGTMWLYSFESKGYSVTDIDEIEMKLWIAESEDAMKLKSIEYVNVDGLEAAFCRMDMIDSVYEGYGTERWLLEVHDSGRGVGYAINFVCDDGMFEQDCFAIISHLDFK